MAFNSNPLAGLITPIPIPPVPLMTHLGAGTSGFAGYRDPNFFSSQIMLNDRIGAQPHLKGRGFNSVLGSDILQDGGDRLKRTLYRTELLNTIDNNKGG